MDNLHACDSTRSSKVRRGRRGVKVAGRARARVERARRRSGGSGSSAASGSPVSGWANARRHECRNGRSRPSRARVVPAAAVARVADDRVPDRLQVDPDLVRAAGPWGGLEQGRARRAARGPRTPSRPSRPPTRSTTMRAARRPSGASTRKSSCAGAPRDEREVPAVDRVAAEHRLQGLRRPRPCTPRSGARWSRRRAGARSRAAAAPRRARAARPSPSSRFTSVPSPMRRRRVREQPGRLRPRREVRRPGSEPRPGRRPGTTAPGSAQLDLDAISPPTRRNDLRAGRAVDRDAPRRDRALDVGARDARQRRHDRVEPARRRRRTAQPSPSSAAGPRAPPPLPRTTRTSEQDGADDDRRRRRG